MKFIPSYEPLRKFYISYKHDAFTEPFNLEKVLCEVTAAVQPLVEIDAFARPADNPWLRMALGRRDVNLNTILYNFNPPPSGAIGEYAPLFIANDEDVSAALVFQTPGKEHPADFEFGEMLASRLRFVPYEMGFDFSLAHLLVNEDIALVSGHFFQSEEDENFEILKDNFPDSVLFRAACLPGWESQGLDAYLWPIAPKTWIAAEYPAGSPRAVAMEPALNFLRERGHSIHRVPGLEPLERDGAKGLPSYTHGLIVNGLALVPQYGRAEDEAVKTILSRHGYGLVPLDCTDLSLAGLGLRTLVKTVPERLPSPPDDFVPTDGVNQ
jgi:hypothetical protein